MAAGHGYKHTGGEGGPKVKMGPSYFMNCLYLYTMKSILKYMRKKKNTKIEWTKGKQKIQCTFMLNDL